MERTCPTCAIGTGRVMWATRGDELDRAHVGTLAT
jgi:hypothetical protein